MGAARTRQQPLFAEAGHSILSMLAWTEGTGQLVTRQAGEAVGFWGLALGPAQLPAWLRAFSVLTCSPRTWKVGWFRFQFLETARGS